MKMRFLDWLLGKHEKKRNKHYETMPAFRKIWESLPSVINPTIIPQDTKTESDISTVQDRAAAKSVAEKEAKTAASNENVKGVYARIQTAERKNLDIIWLLKTSEDVPYKSVHDLMKNYGDVKGSDSYKGMSVNYASNGKLYEISPLCEQDLDDLAGKMESRK